MLWCPLRYQHKNKVRFVFTSSCLSYLRYLCLFAYSGVQHILCCVFVLFFFVFFVPYVDSFLSFLIAPSVFSNVYLPVSLDCPFWLPLRYSLTFICQCLWIVLFDCPSVFSNVYHFNNVSLIVHGFLWTLAPLSLSRCLNALRTTFISEILIIIIVQYRETKQHKLNVILKK